MIGIGLHIGNRVIGGSIDAQAQAHYDRVIADGGVVPAGVSGVNAFFTAVKSIYGTSDITTAVSVGVDAHYLGYKLGAGAGTTLGQAAQKLYSCAGSSGDVVQTTAASQPLLLAHNGANYYKGVAVTGNSCSAPKSLTQTDTLEFIAKLDLIDGTDFQGYAIGTVDNSSTSRQFYVIYNSGSFGLIYGSGLAQFASATTPTSRYDGWLRVTLEKSGVNSLVKFYKSEETSITNPSLVTWTQIGTTVTGIYAAMTTTATNFNILSGGGSSNASNAKCYYAHIAETIGGSPLSVFNPATYNSSTSQTQWTSTTGEVWAINTGTATTGYKGVLVDRTIVQGDGVDDRLTSGTLTSRTSFTVYIAVNVLSFSGRFMDGSSGLTKLLYGSATNISMYGGAGGFDFVDEVAQRLQMLTANFQATPNVYSRINNNTRATTAISIGSAASTGINLFTDGDGANPANVMINTVIQSTTNDPLNDAMYNYIRSINNNAF
jgi:hypothetical protein